MLENLLDTAFQFKRVSSTLASSLFHQKEVMAVTARNIPGMGPWAGEKSIFDTLADETAYLHETAGNIREALFSLIDARINAVFSALVLIPTLIGQTLGTNILGAPFTLYLWEVTAWIIISLLVVGWIFYRPGRLR